MAEIVVRCYWRSLEENRPIFSVQGSIVRYSSADTVGMSTNSFQRMKLLHIWVLDQKYFYLLALFFDVFLHISVSLPQFYIIILEFFTWIIILITLPNNRIKTFELLHWQVCTLISESSHLRCYTHKAVSSRFPQWLVYIIIFFGILEHTLSL